MNAITPAALSLSETLDSNDSVVVTGKTEDGGASASHAGNTPKTSKMGWGGARANSGGPRPNSGRPRKQPPFVTQPLGLRWYVAETYGLSERQAVTDMARQGWEAYLPLNAIWRRDRVLPTMLHKIVQPLMPGVVFVRFDRNGATWGTIREYCHGVRGIMRGAGGLPAPVRDLDVQALRDGDAERLKLESVVRGEVRAAGQRVRIGVGQFAQFPAIVMACDGLLTAVEVEIFGRLMRLELAWGQVEAV